MKNVAVIVQTNTPERVGEAMRAALGLCLRDDCVTLAVCEPVRLDDFVGDIFVVRGREMLLSLGQTVCNLSTEEVSELIHQSDVVEVWT